MRVGPSDPRRETREIAAEACRRNFTQLPTFFMLNYSHRDFPDPGLARIFFVRN